MARDKYNWEDAERDFGKCTDREIADKYKIPRNLVANYRLLNKVPVVSVWSRFEHLLGTMTDADLARLIGYKANTVTVKRIRAGVPSYQNGKEKELENEFCRTLTETPKQQVVTACGNIDVLTPTHIYECKTVLNTTSAHTGIGQLLCYSRAYPNRKLGFVCRKTKTSPEIIATIKELGIEIIELPKPTVTGGNAVKRSQRSDPNSRA